jgi:hypothetical protein
MKIEIHVSAVRRLFGLDAVGGGLQTSRQLASVVEKTVNSEPAAGGSRGRSFQRSQPR